MDIGLPIPSVARYAAIAWIRYGQSKPPVEKDDAHSLLDQFMPVYEVSERHLARVAAPVDITFRAAAGLDLRNSRIIRGIFRTRELILGSKPVRAEFPKALLDWAVALGWSVLAEVPGREIIFGAATKPWEPNPVFHALRADEFAAFTSQAT